MQAAELPILESFAALADATRSRLLWLLDGQELTVSELCAVLRLPQSTVSRHLKTLADAGWVSQRRDGTSRYYTLVAGEPSEPRRQIWDVMRAELGGRRGLAQDRRRLEQVLGRRNVGSQEFFARTAGAWDRVRDELFGAGVVLRGIPALLPRDAVVVDLGCGTGATAELLAPWVRRLLAVDASAEMLGAARTRLRGASAVEFHQAPLESLPIPDATVDLALMVLVLHHLPTPVRALSEAARVLVPGGQLLVIDMRPHEHEDYRQRMGHVWLGFSESHLDRLLQQAGFHEVLVHALPPAPDATGPDLFVARAVRPPSAVSSSF